MTDADTVALLLTLSHLSVALIVGYVANRSGERVGWLLGAADERERHDQDVAARSRCVQVKTPDNALFDFEEHEPIDDSYFQDWVSQLDEIRHRTPVRFVDDLGPVLGLGRYSSPPCTPLSIAAPKRTAPTEGTLSIAKMPALGRALGQAVPPPVVTHLSDVHDRRSQWR